MEQQIAYLNQFYVKAIDFLANYSFQIIGALIIVTIGWFLSKYVYNLLIKFFQQHDFDVTLGKFVANGIRILVFGAMLVVAIGKLGISIAPFIAAVGAVFLTAGLAIQGSVANYAAGISLIITRPFKIGDTILINKVYGEVEEIRLAYTTLRTEDEELITVPNKNMIGEVIVNSFKYRIVESSIGISYDADAEKAIAIIRRVIEGIENVSKETQAIIGIEKFGDSAVELGVRYWVPTRNFFKIQYEANMAIYKALREANITIPYPQREIRMVSQQINEGL
ncbi:MAG: mechanosensitive ion channel family protein [Sulfuricurvum sp.]|uniref:mechanosensitive ion channel family protein n=1 Tax=Sulfuricurvum sp. TaxID=2025608 RepID=UPI002602961D|nr:mechanosensitive ion channel family protein [Sulfuricurvum sp.]MDD2369888.1 mechanosensitive ion channel family protein [Sulfuricurvum sp.]MDD2951538.1 mechanosensitive ion channel family protein [Sulfuricurvum sp.]MDD5117645.1 mechanosensitive ion channel family protein [Sulfuricurvum sp.]